LQAALENDKTDYCDIYVGLRDLRVTADLQPKVVSDWRSTIIEHSMGSR
jgi:hypothetical protein